jgi:hypothetical protein
MIGHEIITGVETEVTMVIVESLSERRVVTKIADVEHSLTGSLDILS